MVRFFAWLQQNVNPFINSPQCCPYELPSSPIPKGFEYLAWPQHLSLDIRHPDINSNSSRCTLARSLHNNWSTGSSNFRAGGILRTLTAAQRVVAAQTQGDHWLQRMDIPVRRMPGHSLAHQYPSRIRSHF